MCCSIDRDVLETQPASSKPYSCVIHECSGQASVEAALLIPVLFIVLTLLLQPLVYLYTRTVMQGAVGEALRVYARDSAVTEYECRSFVLRRLEAIPSLAYFHAGDWTIECSKSSQHTTIAVQGSMKPLPLFLPGIDLVIPHDENGFIARVEVSAKNSPDWLEDDYKTWISMWG